MDNSSSLFAMPSKDAWRFFDRFGPDRFFFGTDFPMWTHKEELARFDALGLTPEMREKILWQNFDQAVIQARDLSE